MNTHGMAAPFFHFLHVALFAEVDYEMNSSQRREKNV